jgi:hypothetical protein
MSDPTRYPLEWPVARPRTPKHKRARARFSTKSGGYSGRSLSVADALDRLRGELRRLGVRWDRVVVSTNVPVRLDGLPRSGVKEDRDDPGAAVYFPLKGQPKVLSCDAWDRVADNIASIAADINATRAKLRYKVSTLEQAFAGYPAIPATTSRGWASVLMVSESADLETVRAAHRELSLKHHPDRGGDEDRFKAIQEAWASAKADLE